MKGDFTRSTFDKKKHYRKVNMQQGRVQMDADWNEQNDIQFHHEQTFLNELVGKSGTLGQNNGFKILENFSFTWDSAYPNATQSAALGTFLRDNFGLLWIAEKNPVFTKTNGGNTLSISSPDGSHSATITRGAGNPVLAIDAKPAYEFLQSGNDVWTRGYLIGKGDYYVDGILCENEADVEASRQPDTVLSKQPARFLLFEWESADSDPVKKAIAGFVAGIFPALAGVPLTVTKTSNTLLTITAQSGPVSATIELKGGGKAVLKSNPASQQIDLVAKASGSKTQIFYPVESPWIPSPPSAPASYLAYLDVFDKHVTYLEDPYIREKALGGPDTATRTRTAWLVKLLPFSSSNVDKCNAWNAIDSLIDENLGRMQARSEPTPPQTNMCKLSETAGYRGLENHLYRVEVHMGGDSLAESTFKWSRDNGIVVSAVTKFTPLENKIEVQNRGRDNNLDFKQDTWIEITDEVHERLALPGTLVKIKEVKEKTIEYYPDTVIGHPVTEDNFAQNPKARRWDSNGVIKPTSANYYELEDGVQIRLSEGHYRTGDYWIVPARANTEDSIEWPRVGSNLKDEPLALLPAGVFHHYAPLAVVEQNTNGKFTIKSDERSFFSSLADLILIHYAGGDSQEALPNNALAQPLRVAVTLGRTPISKTPMGSAKVRFTLVKPSSSIIGVLTKGAKSSAPTGVLEVDTDGEGIADCLWTLADGEFKQQVRAELVECVDAKVPPIYFSATQPIWFYYVAGDGAEEAAGKAISLSAGVSLGSKPIPGNYSVKFSVTIGSGTLSNATPPLDSQGIATTSYTLSSSPQRQQIKAELLLSSNPTNLPPVFFNVAVLEQETSANTGLLKLVIPSGQGQFPLVYGPFKHYLPNLKVPPALMLGLIGLKNDNVVKYTEDYILVTRTGVHFKPVEITNETFKVHLWVAKSAISTTTATTAPATTSRTRTAASRPAALAEAESLGGTAMTTLRSTELSSLARTEVISRGPGFTIDKKIAIILRWWAIPGQEKEPQSGEPVEQKPEPLVEFNKTDYKLGETVTVTVTDPNLPLDDSAGTVKVLITTDPPTGAVIELNETGPQTNVYVASFSTREGAILIGRNVKDVPGLGRETQLIAVYEYNQNKPPATDEANIH